MCKKRSSVVGHVRGRPVRLDPCIRDEVQLLNRGRLVTLGSCCGHGIYPTTIVVKDGSTVKEYYSGVNIPRTRRFYRMDASGFYFIPEVMQKRRRRNA